MVEGFMADTAELCSSKWLIAFVNSQDALWGSLAHGNRPLHAGYFGDGWKTIGQGRPYIDMARIEQCPRLVDPWLYVIDCTA
jgi:hypothetical protein